MQPSQQNDLLSPSFVFKVKPEISTVKPQRSHALSVLVIIIGYELNNMDMLAKYEYHNNSAD